MLRFIPVSELEKSLGISGPSSSWIATQRGGGWIVETTEVVEVWDPGGMKHSDSGIGRTTVDQTVGTLVGKLMASWER